MRQFALHAAWGLIVCICLSAAVQAEQPIGEVDAAPETRQSLQSEGRIGDAPVSKNDAAVKLGSENQPEPDDSSSIPSSPSSETTAVSPPSLKSNDSMSSSSLTSWSVVLLSLLGIVAMILVLGWAARRFGGLSAMGIRNMRVVSAIPVGTREKVALIDVHGKQFLIGITPHNITHLHSFDEAPSASEEPVKSDFAAKLQGLMGRKDASDSAIPQNGQHHD